MRAVALLSLSLLSACIESASAQPRPDAGRRFIIRGPASNPPRRTNPREVNRALLRALLGDTDAGVAELFIPGPSVVDPRDAIMGTALQATGDGGLGAMISGRAGRSNIGMGGLGRLSRSGAMPDGGVSIGSMGGGLGTRGSAPGRGSGMGFGRWNPGASRDARYDEVTVQGDLPRWAVVSELSRAAVRTHNCLLTLGRHGPIDAPVRWIVRPPTTLDAITVEGAAEGVTRCAREALQRMILGPVTAPVEVSAWLRAAASVTP
jgi:hypothetical protein